MPPVFRHHPRPLTPPGKSDTGGSFRRFYLGWGLHSRWGWGTGGGVPDPQLGGQHMGGTSCPPPRAGPGLSSPHSPELGPPAPPAPQGPGSRARGCAGPWGHISCCCGDRAGGAGAARGLGAASAPLQHSPGWAEPRPAGVQGTGWQLVGTCGTVPGGAGSERRAAAPAPQHSWIPHSWILHSWPSPGDATSHRTPCVPTALGEQKRLLSPSPVTVPPRGRVAPRVLRPQAAAAPVLPAPAALPAGAACNAGLPGSSHLNPRGRGRGSRFCSQPRLLPQEGLGGRAPGPGTRWGPKQLPDLVPDVGTRGAKRRLVLRARGWAPSPTSTGHSPVPC